MFPPVQLSICGARYSASNTPTSAPITAENKIAPQMTSNTIRNVRLCKMFRIVRSSEESLCRKAASRDCRHRHSGDYPPADDADK